MACFRRRCSPATVALLSCACLMACATTPSPSPPLLTQADPIDNDLLRLLEQVPADAALIAAFDPEHAERLPFGPGSWPIADRDLEGALEWVRASIAPLADANGRTPNMPVLIAAGLTRDSAVWAAAADGALPDLSEPPSVGLVVVVPGDPVTLLAELDPIAGTALVPFAGGITMRQTSCSSTPCEWMGQTAADRPVTPAWEAMLRTDAAWKVHLDLRRWRALSAALMWRDVFDAVGGPPTQSTSRIYARGVSQALAVAAGMSADGRFAEDATFSVSAASGLLVRHTTSLTEAGSAAYTESRDLGRTHRISGCSDTPDAPAVCLSMPMSPRLLLARMAPSPTASGLRYGGWKALVYAVANSTWSLLSEEGLPDAALAVADTYGDGLVGSAWLFGVPKPGGSLGAPLGLPVHWVASDDGSVMGRLGQGLDLPAAPPPTDDLRVRFDASGSDTLSVVLPGGPPLPGIELVDLRVRTESNTLAASLHLRAATGPVAAPIAYKGWDWRPVATRETCHDADPVDLAAGLETYAAAAPEYRERARAAIEAWIDAAARCHPAAARSIRAGWALYLARAAVWSGAPDAMRHARLACEFGRPAGCNLAEEIEETRRQGTAAPGPGEMLVLGPDPQETAPDARAVRNVVRAHREQLRGCVQVARAEDPRSSSPLRVEFTVGASGLVLETHVTGPEVMRGCLERVIGGLVFPPRPGAGPLRVSYPLGHADQ